MSSTFSDAFGLDWLIVVVLPEADLTEEIIANTRITLSLCIVALLVASIVSVWTAQWITQPIFRLNRAAKAIAQGEWDNAVEINRSDEVGELAKSFNQMETQLQSSFAELSSLNQDLSTSKNQLTQFLEAVPLGVTVHDTTGKLTYANHIETHLNVSWIYQVQEPKAARIPIALYQISKCLLQINLRVPVSIIYRKLKEKRY